MEYFDLLSLVAAGIGLVSLYQVRPCTFILAGNNLLVSRALSAIDQGGAPASQSFQASYIFSEDNLTTAAGIVTICLATQIIFLFVLSRRQVRIGPDAPRVPHGLLVAIGIYLVAYAGTTATMFSHPYGEVGGTRYDIELAGGHTFICSLVVYELARRRLLGEFTARKAFSIIFLIFAVIGYARGGTGLTTGYLITSAILLLPRAGSANRLRNVVRIGTVLVAIMALSFITRGIRAVVASEGTDSVGSFFDGVLRMESERNEVGEGAEAIANASQSATHMLLCITLYDSGNSREWRSIYNVVEYTFIPSFFVRWLGWIRSIEPAVELGGHFIHGGGINVLGELYWNGGWLCVVIMSLAISFFCSWVDIRFRSSPFWLMMVAQFGPSFLMGYGYGFPQVARGAINGLLASSCYLVFKKLQSAPNSFIANSAVTHSTQDLRI